MYYIINCLCYRYIWAEKYADAKTADKPNKIVGAPHQYDSNDSLRIALLKQFNRLNRAHSNSDRLPGT